MCGPALHLAGPARIARLGCQTLPAAARPGPLSRACAAQFTNQQNTEHIRPLALSVNWLDLQGVLMIPLRSLALSVIWFLLQGFLMIPLMYDWSRKIWRVSWWTHSKQ